MAAGTGEEAALVERARLDPSAFGELYERYVPIVYRLVYDRVSSREAAEELTAETFRRVLRAIDGYRPSGGPFGAWVCLIAAATTADYLRVRRPAIGVAGVRAALETLDEAQRTAIGLKLGQDMRVADIAAHMGRSEEAVRLLIHDGLAALRRRLDGGEGRRVRVSGGV